MNESGGGPRRARVVPVFLAAGVILILVAGCASVSSNVAPPIGERVTMYLVAPFYLDRAILQKYPEAEVATRQSFESAFTRTGYWTMGLYGIRTAYERVNPDGGPLSPVDWVDIGRMSGCDAVVIGTITNYDLLDVGYRVEAISTATSVILWEAGGVKRIPFYNVQIQRALNALSARIVGDLMRNGLRAEADLPPPRPPAPAPSPPEGDDAPSEPPVRGWPRRYFAFRASSI